MDGGAFRLTISSSIDNIIYLFFHFSKSAVVQGPSQARTEAAIAHVKNEMAKLRSSQLAYEAGLLDPEMVFRSIGFTTFLSTWLIRKVDPKGSHPSPVAE